MFAAELLAVLTSVFLHRELSHRSVATCPAVATTSRLIFRLYPGISGVEWATVHQLHHRYTDGAGDPHSPAIFGRTKVLLFGPWLYRRTLRSGVIQLSPTEMSPLDRFIVRARWPGRVVGAALLAPWLGLASAVASYVALIAVYSTIIGLTNAFAHPLGRRSPRSLMRRVARGALSLVTAGEGSVAHHENHHKHPRTADFREASRELDIAWMVTLAMSKVRLLKITDGR